MTIPRMLGLLLAFGAIGTAVVAMRIEETRVSREIQELQFRMTDLRRDIWTQQMTLARLRAPGEVLERAEDLNVPTIADPSDGESPGRR